MQSKYPLFDWGEQQRAATAPNAPPGSTVSTGGERRSRHPLSQAFGNRAIPDREELRRMLRQSGQVREIITLDGQVLLDWETYDVATELGLPVRLEEFSGTDPLAFVVVNSLSQPQWDKGKRAVITVRLYAWRDRGRPEKSVPNTDLSPPEDGSEVAVGRAASSVEMAETARVGVSYVTRAKRVEGFGLGEAVISGELNLADAYRRVKLVTDAGLGHMIQSDQLAFETAYREARAVADAGFLDPVKSGEITCAEAYQKVLAGETVGVAAVRARPPTKAELTKRVEELERENRRLIKEAARAAEAEARAIAAEAEVERLNAVLSRSGLAA